MDVGRKAVCLTDDRYVDSWRVWGVRETKSNTSHLSIKRRDCPTRSLWLINESFTEQMWFVSVTEGVVNVIPFRMLFAAGKLLTGSSGNLLLGYEKSKNLNLKCVKMIGLCRRQCRASNESASDSSEKTIQEYSDLNDFFTNIQNKHGSKCEAKKTSTAFH